MIHNEWFDPCTLSPTSTTAALYVKHTSLPQSPNITKLITVTHYVADLTTAAITSLHIINDMISQKYMSSAAFTEVNSHCRRPYERARCVIVSLWFLPHRHVHVYTYVYDLSFPELKIWLIWRITLQCSMSISSSRLKPRMHLIYTFGMVKYNEIFFWY